MENRYGLTERELQIVREVVLGCTNREIAAKLKIGEDVVKQRLCGVFDKVGVSSRLELAYLMLKHEPPPTAGD